jgi:hypothetical protein
LTIINPGDRIQVLAMPSTSIHEGRHGIVETVQDLSRDSHQYLPMARISARADDGHKMLLVIPPDRVKIIR